MVLCEVDDDRHKHWESFVFVSLENVQEVVIFKEAHRSVSNLEMDSTNALNNSLEELEDTWLNLVHFAHLQHFLELCQKECFFDAVGERPVFQKTLKERNGQSAVFG